MLKAKEEAAKDRGESIDKRIEEEVERLRALKEDLEAQIEPLKDKHDELKHKLVEEKARNEHLLMSMSKVNEVNYY